MDFSVPKEAIEYVIYMKGSKPTTIPKPAPQMIKALEGRESILKSVQFNTHKTIKKVYNFQRDSVSDLTITISDDLTSRHKM
jgi:hypothetical protein